MKFKKIRDISLDENSWKDSFFITFDIDWACDEVIENALDIVEGAGIAATFFVTHKTDVLDRIRANDNLELGIHPNFNPLLNGDFQYGKNVEEVLSFYKNMVPDALSVRSHSLTQSSNMVSLFDKFDLRFECNTLIPASSGIELKPWKHWCGGVISVPHSWEDDVNAVYGSGWSYSECQSRSLKVFDFHPIHVFLNTEELSRYELSRDFHSDPKNLKQFINQGRGTCSFLEDLIRFGKKVSR